MPRETISSRILGKSPLRHRLRHALSSTRHPGVVRRSRPWGTLVCLMAKTMATARRLASATSCYRPRASRTSPTGSSRANPHSKTSSGGGPDAKDGSAASNVTSAGVARDRGTRTWCRHGVFNYNFVKIAGLMPPHDGDQKLAAWDVRTEIRSHDQDGRVLVPAQFEFFRCKELGLAHEVDRGACGPRWRDDRDGAEPDGARPAARKSERSWQRLGLVVPRKYE